jgi:putative spermidine/putrescine transport system permease protein
VGPKLGAWARRSTTGPSWRPATRRTPTWGLLIVPGIAFLGVCFVWPLIDIAVKSLTEPGPRNYSALASSSIYRTEYVTTFEIAGATTIACLTLGYPYAYVMNRSRGWRTPLLVAVVLLPFWSSSLVRAFAWTIWLDDNGIVNSTLAHLGLPSLSLIGNAVGTTIGMTHVELPFMVLVLYSGMRRIDPNLTRAAGSLGARPATAFRTVFLPLSKGAIASGCLIVFITSVGYYIIPEILGNPARPMIGESIVTLITEFEAVGEAAALGIGLLAMTLALLAIAKLFNVAAVPGREVGEG